MILNNDKIRLSNPGVINAEQRLRSAALHVSEGERAETVAMWMQIPIQLVHALPDPIVAESLALRGIAIFLDGDCESRIDINSQ